MLRYLITGGAGYIGSHIAKVLMDDGNDVFVIDDLSTGHEEVAKRLNLNLCRKSILSQDDFFYLGKIDCIIHMAGFSQVEESVKDPSKYYCNNICSTIHLLDCMVRFNIKNIIFSSSASVYGHAFNKFQLETDTDKFLLKPKTAYGRSKLMIENMLEDYNKAYGIEYIALRYFNASGACPRGLIGEDHRPETHLIPLVLQVPLGKKDNIKIFGNDYPTKDGTCVRDFIHVCDLADAHIKAAEHLIDGGKSNTYNVGTNKGTSVQEVIDISRIITGHKIPTLISNRRPGDPPSLVAHTGKIKKDLYWRPKYDIEDIIDTAWSWHKNNPNGYGD